MADLKTLLGDELFKQVSEKLDGNKVFLYEGDVKPIVPAGAEFGKSYVSKERFNEVNENNKSLNEQLEKVSANLKTLEEKAAGNDTLKSELKKMQEENDKIKEDSEKTLKDTLAKERRDYEVKMKLIDAGAHSDKLKFLMSEMNLDEVSVDDNKNLIGFKSQLEAQKESFPWAFGEEKKIGAPPNKNGKPPAPKDGLPDDAPSREKIKERFKKFNENVGA